jgi:hypothetical protein
MRFAIAAGIMMLTGSVLAQPLPGGLTREQMNAIPPEVMQSLPPDIWTKIPLSTLRAIPPDLLTKMNSAERCDHDPGTGDGVLPEPRPRAAEDNKGAAQTNQSPDRSRSRAYG